MLLNVFYSISILVLYIVIILYNLYNHYNILYNINVILIFINLTLFNYIQLSLKYHRNNSSFINKIINTFIEK